MLCYAKVHELHELTKLHAAVSFECTSYAVLENCGHVEIGVLCEGSTFARIRP